LKKKVARHHRRLLVRQIQQKLPDEDVEPTRTRADLRNELANERADVDGQDIRKSLEDTEQLPRNQNRTFDSFNLLNDLRLRRKDEIDKLLHSAPHYVVEGLRLEVQRAEKAAVR
jgi:hypothetical protein